VAASGAALTDVPVHHDPEGPGCHRGKKYCKTIFAVITRSASSIKSLGKCRLGQVGQAVEWLQECLDATMVADLSSDGLLILLWLLCRVKPSVQICSLRDLTIKKQRSKYMNLKVWFDSFIDHHQLETLFFLLSISPPVSK